MKSHINGFRLVLFHVATDDVTCGGISSYWGGWLLVSEVNETVKDGDFLAWIHV